MLFIGDERRFQMAVNEEIVTGRKFRKLVDEATKLWQRISFWTKACDVEFDDGETAESKISALTDNWKITEVKFVDALPSDAASHPTTFYWVKG